MNKSQAKSASVIDTHDNNLFKVKELENKNLSRAVATFSF
jgi:hypothetical protein